MMNNKVWLYPDAAERAYLRSLVNLSRQTLVELRNRLNGRQLLSRRDDSIITDAWSDELSQAILEVLSAMLMPQQEAIFRLRDTFTAVAQFNDMQWRLQVRAGTGVDIGPSGAMPPGARFALGSTDAPGRIRAVFGMGVDVYRSEPWLARLQENWTAENSSLIKSITGRNLENVETAIRTGVMQGWSVRTLKEEIMRLSNVSEARAKLIARDQIGKANGALTKERQTDLGVSRYIWMSSDDARVRPHHARADGEVYTWKEGAGFKYGNHPGEEIQCRCWAKPILLDIANVSPRRNQRGTRLGNSNTLQIEAADILGD